jgi:hypothetical protein
MSCTRCHGLLLREWIHRTREYDRDCPGWWWKCLNCGERVDRQILLNRADQAADLAWRQFAQVRALKEWADWVARVPATV